MSPSFYSRRIARNVILCTAAVGGASFVGCLALFPQQYTATASLSMASANAPALPNASEEAMEFITPSGKYTGILHSRSFANQVAQSPELRPYLAESSLRDAAEVIRTGLSITDNKRDGLVYISVTLPAPPLLGPAMSTREAVRNAAAAAANAYARMLRDFVAKESEGGDAVFLAGLDEQAKQIKAEYASASNRLDRYARSVGAGGRPGQATVTVNSRTGAVMPSPSATELASLMAARASLASRLAGASASFAVATLLANERAARPGSLPADDALLRSARRQVQRAKDALARDGLLYGPDHPILINDQQRLRSAQTRLRSQQAAVVSRSSRTAGVQAKLSGYAAAIRALDKRIAEARRHSHNDITAAAAYEQRHTSLLLQFEMLRALQARAAEARLRIVSADETVQIVDLARPPRSSFPDAGQMGFLAMIAAVMLTSVAFFALYLRHFSLAAGRREPVGLAPQ